MTIDVTLKRLQEEDNVSIAVAHSWVLRIYGGIVLGMISEHRRLTPHEYMEE